MVISDTSGTRVPEVSEAEVLEYSAKEYITKWPRNSGGSKDEA